MAGSEDLYLGFGIDADSAVAGVEKVDTALKETEEQAKRTGAAGEGAGAKVKTESEQAAPAVKKVSAAYEAAEAAAKQLLAEVAKMDSQTSMRGMQRSAASVAIAMEDAEKAAKRAGVSLGTFGVNTAEVGTKVEATAAKAARYKDTLGDLGTRGNLAAQGMEALVGRLGSVDGVMGLAKDSGNAFLGTLGSLGFAVLGAKAAIELLGPAWKEANAATKLFMDSIADYATKGSFAAAETIKVETAARRLGEALPTTREGVERLAKAFDLMVPAKAKKDLEEFVKTVEGVKIPKSFDDLKTDAAKLQAAIVGAFEQGGNAVVTFARVNEGSLKEVALRYREAGEKTPDYIQKAIEALDKWREAEGKIQKSWTDGKKPLEDKLAAMTRQHETMVKATDDVEKYVAQANRAGTSDADRAKGLSEIAAKYGLTADGLEDLVTKGLAYEKTVKDAAGSNDTFSGSFDRLNQKIQDSIDKQDRLNRKVSGAYADAKQSVAEYGAALDKTTDSTKSQAQAELDGADATAKATYAKDQTVAGYAAYSEAIEANKQKRTLLTIAEEKAALAAGTSTNAIRDLHGATESFTEFLPTSTKGLRDFASAVEGPIDSMEKMAQQFTYLSDNFASSASIWVEPLITDLEAGKISIDKFNSALEGMRGTVAMLSAWSFASVRDYSNMLAQMAVAEQQYFDKSLAQAQKAAVEAQKLRDQARQDKYEADTAGNQNGMGDSSGGDMGSSSSSTSIVHRSAGMTPQTVGTAIKLKLGR